LQENNGEEHLEEQEQIKVKKKLNKKELA